MPWIATAEDVPGDGTCLFHAVAKQLGKKGKDLRNLVASVIEKFPDSQLHGQSLKEWIQWETKNSSAKHAENLRNGLWGGMLETTSLASLYNKKIYVYTPKSDLCTRIAECLPDLEFTSKHLQSIGPNILCLLYVRKNHYMILHPRHSDKA